MPVEALGGGAGKRNVGVKAKLFTDGGSRGNPGPAAYGYVLETPDGTVLAAHGEAIGVATNNVAEYQALVAGLARAEEAGVDELEVVSDSELLVKQMRGEYKVKNAALRELWEEAQRTAGRLGRSAMPPSAASTTSSPTGWLTTLSTRQPSYNPAFQRM